MRFGHRESISLHPFAPPALPGFNATTGALTPERPALRLREHEHRLCYRSGLPVSWNQPSHHSVSNHLSLPRGFRSGFSPRLTARGVCLAPVSTGSWRLGLRLELAGSPQRPAESSLPNGYGLAVLLLLLSTSPRGDAVTIGYKVQTEPWRGLTPLRLITLTGARAPPLGGIRTG